MRVEIPYKPRVHQQEIHDGLNRHRFGAVRIRNGHQLACRFAVADVVNDYVRPQLDERFNRSSADAARSAGDYRSFML